MVPSFLGKWWIFRDSRQFTLSYYGLPEPDFAPRPWLKYLFITVGAAFILVALWRKLKRRKDSV